MSTTDRVRAYLRECDLSTVTDVECARVINKSSSTMRRMLQREGSIYTTLLREERRRRAKELLERNPHADQWKLADIMGYNQRNSAGRAFQQLFGVKFRDFRALCRGGGR